MRPRLVKRALIRENVTWCSGQSLNKKKGVIVTDFFIGEKKEKLVTLSCE